MVIFAIRVIFKSPKSSTVQCNIDCSVQFGKRLILQPGVWGGGVVPIVSWLLLESTMPGGSVLVALVY